MSELITNPATAPDLDEDPEQLLEAPERIVEAASRPLTLITEREVKFSTAVAGTLRPGKPTRWVRAAQHVILRRASSDARPVPRHYPPRREAFVENAAMAREMYRL